MLTSVSGKIPLVSRVGPTRIGVSRSRGWGVVVGVGGCGGGGGVVVGVGGLNL